jgi:M6 family metalloprotease-like protein
VRSPAIALYCLLSSAAAGEQSKPAAPANGEAYVSSGGFIQLTTKLELARAAQARARETAPPVGPTSLSGTKGIPVICVRFKEDQGNNKHSFDPVQYQQMLFGTKPPGQPPLQRTLSQYYYDMSNRQLILTGRVIGWIDLPQEASYYAEHWGEFLKTVLDAADKEIDFAEFDNDGPTGGPNSGDDNGKVDALFIIHSGTGLECNDPKASIWSQSGHYSDYNPLPFATKSIRKSPSTGGSAMDDNAREEHILIDDYTVQPGLACPREGLTEPAIMPIGVFCHEFGHALGLPDLRARGRAPISRGTGNYCLMSYGAYGGAHDGVHGDRERAECPVGMSAWCRRRLGWAPIQTVATGTLSFQAAAAGGTVLEFDVPGADGKEYFLVENRDPRWVDPFGVNLNWDVDLPDSGLAIWHVDEHVGASSPNWPLTEPGAGQNDAPSLPSAPPPSFVIPHSLVSLVQADGLMNLERGDNFGDGHDLWHDRMVFRDDPRCLAGARSYDGLLTGFGLADIDLTHHKLIAHTDEQDGIPLTNRPEVSVAEASPPPPMIHGIAAVMANTSLEVLPSEVVTLREEPPPAPPRPAPMPQPETISPANTPSPVLIAVPLRSDAAGEDRRRKLIDRAIDLAAFGNKRQTTTKIQLQPSGDAIQRITGLSIPVRDTLRDAAHRFEKDIKPLLQAGARFERVPSTTTSPLKFQQTLVVGKEILPIFGSEVRMYYASHEFRALTSTSIASANVTVTGDHERLTPAQAIAEVASLTGTDIKNLSSAREGIFIADPASPSARIAYEVHLKAGTNAADILIYLDEQTDKILAIR